MKILHVISSFPPAYAYGGALKIAYEVSKQLVKDGHDVTVYTTDVYNENSRLEFKDDPILMDGIKVYHFKNLSNTLAYKNLAIALSIRTALKKDIKNFDIVHIHEYRSFQAILMSHYAQKYGVPYVLQPHGSFPRIIEKQSLKKIYDSIWGDKILKMASKVIALTESELEQFKMAGVPEDKIEIIPNGINLSDYQNLPKYGNFRNKYNIEDEPVILYLGRIHKRKGIDLLIKSFSQISKDFKNAKLVIVGPDNGFKDHLMKMLKELKLEDKVLFTGPLYGIDKLEAYVDADLLVYPAIYEIFGLVPFEAIMCGTPVIVTDECGCGELIKTAECGYLIIYGDIADLKEKIEFLIKNKNEGAKKVCNGKNFIIRSLNWKNITKRVENIYESCI